MRFPMTIRLATTLASFLVAVTVLALPASGQAVKGKVDPDAGPPALTYHGLVPGLDKMETVRKRLGEPFFESRWYNYKLYYHAEGRPGLTDIVHMHGQSATDGLAEVEAASVPKGYETETAIRKKFGAPEYELRMATWKMLDYSEKGVRFALDAKGDTIGVAYIPHGDTRVHSGARKVMDLSHLRQGPQTAPAQPAKLGGLKVGVAEVVLSPQGKDWLGRPYTVHDDLKARMAIFSLGDLTVALIGADLFGMGWDEINVIREGAKKLGVTEAIFAMSHNHAAGDTIGVYGHYPAEYIAHIQQQVIKGVGQALSAMKPVGQLRVASRELPMDGIRVIDLFRNARNPGVLDPQIDLIQALDDRGRPITTIIHFACHVESLQKGAREISADFPGYMCDALKAKGFGQPVFLNGAVGGMVSGDNRERTHASSKEMGLKLAGIVEDLAKTAQQPGEFRFSLEQRRVEIPMTNPGFKALYESELRDLHDGRVVSDMLYFQLGEAQLVSLPGELLPEVSFEILEKMEGFPRMLIGLANDEMGYMIPPYDFRAKYYEETMSQGPVAALIVRDTALRMIQGIK